MVEQAIPWKKICVFLPLSACLLGLACVLATMQEPENNVAPLPQMIELDGQKTVKYLPQSTQE